jgi:SM-20-related protein
MMTAPSSVPWLSDTALATLTDEIVSQGYSIQPSGLDKSTCSDLMASARRLDELHLLRHAGVGHNRAEIADIRGDRILWLEPGLAPATDDFLQLADRVRIHFNRHLYMGLEEYEGHLACYAPCAGYKKHLDRIQGSDIRMLTLIVYLNDRWNVDDGGRLRLYLNDGSHRDVTPQSGTVVAFLSGEYWHEVLPSRRERWAITGWFRRMTA